MQYVIRWLGRLNVVVFLGFAGVVTTPALAQVCTGDCNSDHRVVVSELVTGVNIALNSSPVTPCLAMDADGDGRVAVNELVAAVNSLLRGCPATHTPTVTATFTRTFTPTITSTATQTFTPTIAGSPTQTLTPSITRTPTATFTPTSSTPSATPTPTIEPLTLAVQINPDPVAPGDTMVAAITITNRRSAALTAVVIQAVLPLNGVDPVNGGFVSGPAVCAGGICRPGQPITWNIGMLPGESARTVTVPLTVSSGAASPADGTVLTVNATATASGGSSRVAAGSTTVDAAHALALTLDSDTDAAQPGTTVGYTLSFGNRSTQLQTDGTLTFTLPAGVTFESATGGGIETDGAVVWALGNLSPGDSGLRDVVVRVDGNAREGEALLAEATLTAGTEMAAASAITHVQADSVLTANIAVGPDPIVPGESVLISMTVTNRGPVDLFNVVAAVRMPAELAAVNGGFASDGAVCFGGICNFPERVIWNLGTLAAGKGVTVTIPATVNSAAAAPPNGTLVVFDADATADTNIEARARRSVRVRGTRSLEVEMDLSPQPARANGDLLYTLTFGNRGTGLLPNTVLEMALPAGTSFQNASNLGVVSAGMVRWTLGDLTPGASGTRELLVRVDPGVTPGEPIRAEATLVSGTASARAQEITQVESASPLTIELAAGPDPVQPSETLLLSLTLTNRGLVDLFDVATAVRMPPELAAVNAGFASNAPACFGGICDFPERVIWTIGTLPAGQGITVTIPTTVNAVATTPAGTVIMLDADATAQGGIRARTRESIAVRGSRALELEVEAEPQPVSASEELRYLLTFGNRGIGLLQDAILEMPVPAGATFQSASDGGAEIDGAVRWTLGNLAPGVTGVREVVVRVDPNRTAGEPVVCDALATSGAVTAHAKIVTQVETAVVLTAHLTAAPDPVAPSETTLLSLTVTNRGLVDLLNVTAAVRMPVEMAAVNAGFASDAPACFGGICDFPERVVWTLGTVPAGQGVTVTFPATVNAVATTPNGSVIVLDVDANSGNGERARARRNIAVRDSRALELEMEAGPEPVDAEENLHYTLTFGNRGTGLFQDVELAMPVPAGTTFESASDGGLEVDGVVHWPAGDLAPGASGIRKLVVQVDSGIVLGQPIAAEATLTSGTVAAHAAVDTQVEAAIPLTVNLTTAPDPVAPSEAMLISMTVTNRGLVDLFDVDAAVRMPIELAAVNAGFASNAPACFGGICDFPERVIWSLGTLAAGRGITVTIPATVGAVATVPSGSVILLDADASANDGSKARTRRNVAVQANRPLEIEIATSPAPADAGEDITYTLTFGNRSGAMLAAGVIAMPVPAGTSFQSASAGGTEEDGIVQWTLGTLAPGASGVLEVTVQVDPSATPGEPIQAGATLTAGAQTAHAHAVTQVQDNVPLSVSVTASPDPVTPGQAVLISLMVTNNGAVPLFGVTAGIRMPQEASAFNQIGTTGGASCFGGICDFPERVVWTLGTAGTLNAGQSVTVTMPPPIPGAASSPPDGTVILFDADVSANDGTQVRARANVAVQ